MTRTEFTPAAAFVNHRMLRGRPCGVTSHNGSAAAVALRTLDEILISSKGNAYTMFYADGTEQEICSYDKIVADLAP